MNNKQAHQLLMERIYAAHKNHQRIWAEAKANKLSEWGVNPDDPPFKTTIEANGYAYKAAEPQAKERDEAMEQLFEGMPLDEFCAGDQKAIDKVLDFAEVDVPAFRCGYVKEHCYRRLKRFDLTDEQKQRLRQLALDMCLSSGYRREIIELTRLMIQLADKSFMEELHKLEKVPDEYRAKKAWRMRKVISNGRKDLREE